jgi:curved DNA-binding protein CbpA
MAAPIRNPYSVLGVSPGISDEQLHAAYRRLVQLHHPDHNPGDLDASRRFEEIQEAYAHVRRLRAKGPTQGQSSPTSAAEPDVEARLAKLERDLRDAQASRARARRAASEAAADTTNRPSDEELGYVTTEDSVGKILADARSELSDWLDQPRDQSARRRVADLIDQLSARLRGDSDPGPRKKP